VKTLPSRALAAAIALLALAATAAVAEGPAPDAPEALALSGLVGAHDPTIVACDGKYYRFSSGLGIPMAVSGDLLS